jgi:ATP-dependent DNA helicase RecG
LADLTAILHAAQVGETSDWEFKSAAGGLPGSLWETYSAMANTEGGTIVLGVREKDGRTTLDGITPEQAERYVRDIWSTLNNRTKVSRNLLGNDDVVRVPIEGAELVTIRVPRAARNERPVFLNGQPLTNSYRRNHEGDFRCPEDVVRRMFADAEPVSADHRILVGFGLSDLDPVSLAQYRQLFRATKADHPWLACEDQELLEKLGGWRFDRESGRSGLTLAGLLMFGKTEAIRDPSAAPAFFPDYRERLDPNTRWTHRIYPDGTWEANLFQFYQRAWPRLIADVPVPFHLEAGQRRDDTPVHDALREAFVNSLIHADHSAPGGVVVERFPDRFILENPGTLLVSEAQFWRGGVSECRNKSLQQMFIMLGRGERAGSGVDKIVDAWKRQHWRTPQLEAQTNPDRVRLTLLMVSLIPEATLTELRTRLGHRFNGLGAAALQALATAQLEGSVSNQRLQQLVAEHPTDITYLLTKLCDRKLLVSDGRRRWTRYQLPWRVSSRVQTEAPQNISDSSGKADSSSGKAPDSSGKADSSSGKIDDPVLWAHLEQIAAPVAGTARAKKVVVRQTILDLCNQRFIGLADLADLLGRSPVSLRNEYLSPMVKEGILVHRFPAEPNHPQQAYQTTRSPATA